MDIPSGWRRGNLLPLVPIFEPALIQIGAIATDAGAAVSWLADAPRKEGLLFPLASMPSDRVLATDKAQALLFDDHTFLVGRRNGRLYPAPFFCSAQSDPKPAQIDALLKHLGDWPPEWTQGKPEGLLVPSFHFLRPVCSPEQEDTLVAILQALLVVLGLEGHAARWCSQPVGRDGSLQAPRVSLHMPPGARAVPGAGTALTMAIMSLWIDGFPIPTLPGHSLRDGSHKALDLDIVATCPPLASAHQRLTAHTAPMVRDVAQALAGRMVDLRSLMAA